MIVYKTRVSTTPSDLIKYRDPEFGKHVIWKPRDSDLRSPLLLFSKAYMSVLVSTVSAAVALPYAAATIH